ncbi:MAG: hypothetical protein LBK40_08255, partial [Spirochaetaceae bacterium]|nr:hypothetical protein [Spirochaetaceae bacterium]
QATAPAAQALRALILSLGLPPDSLSGFLIASFKNFSMAMDPAQLAKIRKQLGRLASPVRALAAAAAANKGVALRDEALSAYASAIDPASENSGDAKNRQGYSKKRKDLSAFREIPALAKEIKALSGAVDSPWTLLNRLPGKNGAFWMVFPLNCSADGIDFDITLRLLLENQGGLPLRAMRLAVDIISAGGRRLFVLDRPGAGGEARLYLDPLPSKAGQMRLEKELRKVLVPPAGGVRILEAGGLFVLDGEAGLPLQIDEEA